MIVPPESYFASSDVIILAAAHKPNDDFAII